MKIEERKQIEVVRDYDVAVCGGGFGGIAAALAAARQGKRVVLFEKQFMLGGLGTAGLVTIYLPLCDGYGRQVSFGIVEELLHLSMKYGAEEDIPEHWKQEGLPRTAHNARLQARYNPQMFAMAVEQLLTDTGVDILYGTYVTDVKMENDVITHLIVENKSGRCAYGVRSVVDATGDADIAKFTNAPTDTFKQGNVLAAWYYAVGKAGYDLVPLGFADIPDEEKDPDAKTETLVERRFSGLDGEELSLQTRLSHQQTFKDVLHKRKQDPTCMPVTVATTPQVRMTRKIVGEYVLTAKEMHTRFEDSIGMVSDWKKRGPVYEVPYRTLYSAAVKNLIFAGRCTSVDETLWDIMRVIPCCAVTGQAAGTAAAMTDDFTTLDAAALQQQLVRDGVKLHEE